jgi:PadR family transcriptional regulator, regulatory protein PadR
MEMPKYCDMRGMLSFQIIWLLNKKAMCGEELADELGKKREDKPNPGTIYPALKALKNAELIEQRRIGGRKKEYILTLEGRNELSRAYDYFKHVYGDIIKDGLKVATLAEKSALETKEPAPSISTPLVEPTEKRLDDLGIDYI